MILESRNRSRNATLRGQSRRSFDLLRTRKIVGGDEGAGRDRESEGAQGARASRLAEAPPKKNVIADSEVYSIFDD